VAKLCENLPSKHSNRLIYNNNLKVLEVRAGIEPASADLQSDASPLCHRTPGRRRAYMVRRLCPGQEPRPCVAVSRRRRQLAACGKVQCRSPDTGLHGAKKFADTEVRAINARSAGLSSLFSSVSASIGTKNSCAWGSWCFANPL
jgi:hypothetical protein